MSSKKVLPDRYGSTTLAMGLAGRILCSFGKSFFMEKHASYKLALILLGILAMIIALTTSGMS